MPGVRPGMSKYPSCRNLRLTQGGIGAGGVAVSAGGAVGLTDVGARAEPGAEAGGGDSADGGAVLAGAGAGTCGVTTNTGSRMEK